MMYRMNLKFCKNLGQSYFIEEDLDNPLFFCHEIQQNDKKKNRKVKREKQR